MPTRPPVHNAHNRRLDYEQHRGSARQRGYTKAWDKLALAYRRQHPLCVGCLAVGRTTLAQCVDHVLPHRGNLALMWDNTNLQALCMWHHDVVKQILESLHAHGRIDDGELRMNSKTAMQLTRNKIR